jgi:hypothetical protein
MLSMHRFNNEKTKLFFMPTFKSINNMKLFAKLTFMMISVCSYLSLSAQVSYNFTATPIVSTGTVPSITASTITAANSTITTIQGSGTPASSTTFYTGATGSGNVNVIAKTGVLATPITATFTANTYLQFTLVASANNWATITGIKWGNFSLPTTGPTQYSVYASNNNFATSTLIASGASGTSATNWTSVDPATTSFSGLTAGTITIRIIASGGVGTTPTGTAGLMI